MSKLIEAAETLRVKTLQWRNAQSLRGELYQKHQKAMRAADALADEVTAAEEALKAAALDEAK